MTTDTTRPADVSHDPAERNARILAHIERNKNNPRREEYNRLLNAEIAEYRRKIQEEAERELAEAGK